MSESQEKWKPILKYQNYTFDGKYEVSNWGNVREVKTGRPVAFFSDGKGQGYLKFKIFDVNHKRAVIRIHRLVAYEFIGRPAKKMEIDHIDGNVKNNSFSNLRWCTHGENMKFLTESRKGNEKQTV